MTERILDLGAALWVLACLALAAWFLGAVLDALEVVP